MLQCKADKKLNTYIACTVRNGYLKIVAGNGLVHRYAGLNVSSSFLKHYKKKKKADNKYPKNSADTSYYLITLTNNKEYYMI